MLITLLAHDELDADLIEAFINSKLAGVVIPFSGDYPILKNERGEVLSTNKQKIFQLIQKAA